MITGQQVAEKALELCMVEKNWLGKIKSISPQNIPYVNGGRTLSGMDCQGLVRWVLEQLGVKHVKGSNKMWRTMLSEKGTIAECISAHSSVPLGALIFICDYSTIPKGYTDPPDAEHVYIKIADGWLLHASFSNGKLMVRKFADKAIPNGGPAHYGLIAGVDYGMDTTGVSVDDSANSEPVEKKVQWKPHYSHLRFQQGDKGGGTREIQTALRRLGYDVAVDGTFGPLTEAAVIEFQEKNGLEPDGVVGKNTWAALIETVNAA